MLGRLLLKQKGLPNFSLSLSASGGPALRCIPLAWPKSGYARRGLCPLKQSLRRGAALRPFFMGMPLQSVALQSIQLKTVYPI